jgi:hypothetical protein
MPTRRDGHVCALVKDTESGDAEIIAVGGYKSRVVEIFNVNALIWRTGGKLLQNSLTNSF